MQTLISFLRGVNMTGHNTIKMTDLSLLFNNLGFRENKTYIQSGNVIFKAEDNLTVKEIEGMIEKEIFRKYGYSVPAIVRTVDELKNLAPVNPYLAEPGFDPAKMAVIFLVDKITDNQSDKMININYPPDKYQLGEKEIFTFCPNGFGKTKLYTNYFENRMGITGTARNWKTVMTLLAMAEQF